MDLLFVSIQRQESENGKRYLRAQDRRRCFQSRVYLVVSSGLNSMPRIDEEAGHGKALLVRPGLPERLG